MLSHALHASFADASEQRATDRRVLRLEAQAATPAGDGGIQIHNLSRTGMLAESTAALPIGSSIEVEMAGGARQRAEVVWRDADLFGCRFTKPLSQATLSAALLRAKPLTPSAPEAAKMGESDALTRLREHWNSESAPVANDNRLPVGKRAWIIVGLALAGWAAPTALLVTVLA